MITMEFERERTPPVVTMGLLAEPGENFMTFG